MTKKPPIPIQLYETGTEHWVILLSDGNLMEIKGVAQLSDLFIKLLQPSFEELVIDEEK